MSTDPEEDQRLQIMDTDRPRQTKMRIRGLTEQRSESRRLANVIEGAKQELKIVKAEIENLSSDIVRLNDPNDDLKGMQKFIEFGE